MQEQRLAGQFATIFQQAVGLAQTVEADALLVLLDGPTDWEELRQRAVGLKVIVAADTPEELVGAPQAELLPIALDMNTSPVFEKLSQALLIAVADEHLAPSSRVVALYSGFEAGEIDSMSVLKMSDHLGRLTVRDLQNLQTSVPLDTLQIVVNLAVEIGREGREGKAVGTMFVVGDHNKVLRCSHPQGFDPVRGYSRKDRNLRSGRVRESLKEVAQLDGAFIIAADGTVLAACQYIDAPATDIALPKGFGARHWAAAAISRATKAIAVTVSESSGTVRLFQNGNVVLRVEPFRRPIKWKEFGYEPPDATS
jgi:DNA integrity scanning protein DisA with diadenylate cyclase activity